MDSRRSPRSPSGLFPAGKTRPTWREAHPVTLSATAFGAGTTALWLLLVGLLAESVRSYIWMTIGASLVAWAVAAALATHGDRGAAVGVALAAGTGIAVAATVVAATWAVTGWPMW